MQKQTAGLELIGRILLALIFLVAGVGKITNYHGTQAYMQSYGVPGGLLPLVIACELFGSIGIMVGYYTRISAAVLALFSIAAIVIFHHTVPNEMAQIILLAELSFTGGLILLAVHGAGPWSIDRRCHSSK